MLNGIVQSEPRYQWRESSGCIEVFPVSGSDPLLDTMISSFRVSDVTREEAIVQLMNLAEVRAVTASMNLNRRKATYPPSRNVEEKFSMLLERVTLRQALNRIATDSGAKFWLFRKYDDGSFSLSTSSW